MKNRFILLISTLFFSCSNSSNNPTFDSPETNKSSIPEQTYEEKKMSLEEEEQSQPLQFIIANGTFRRNIFAEWVMEGTVTSNATVAKYKDVVLEFTFYTKTDTKLGSKSVVYYEFLDPNGSFNFKSKIPGYSNAAKFSINVIDATPVY